MIDPKFNALPVDAEGDFEEGQERALSGTPATRPRQGLSINDTIAASANMSVGSRGVDTSGTAVGAGAGAGTTYLTPEADESAAPTVVPGARGSGTTPRGDAMTGQPATTRLDAGTEGQAAYTSTEGQPAYGFTVEEISERAYRCWHRRGCPHGSPEVDWESAVEELRAERELDRRVGATA